MSETNELPDPAKLLKKVLAEAHFENTDIGGAVFSMLDALSYDINAQGFEWSDATEDLMQEVVNILAKDYDEIRSDEDVEEEEAEVVEIVEDEVEEEEKDPIVLGEVFAQINEEEEEEIPYLEEDLEVESDGKGNQEIANKG